jgi:hypothetical protein
MDPNMRPQRPTSGPEKDLLEGFLDFQRATLLWKVSGLNDAELRRIWVPSGTSLLGLVRHLGYVERWWFQGVFAGLDVEIPWRATPRVNEWQLATDDTAETVLGFYRAEVEQSRAITSAGSLDELARRPDRPHTLRWILIHMIEETARHVGHADILRELTDGATGE